MQQSAAETVQRTGWGGCSHYKPTIGELVESSAAAVDVWRQRLARGEATQVDLTTAKRTAAMYALLAGKFGADTKLCRVSGRDIADAKVAAFLAEGH